jgi:peptidoglycan/LPS O-acetylase OafA/YrhL
MKYIKAFDSIRALAIFFVVFFHWVPGNVVKQYTPYGFNVIDVFYVLSSFLITQILLSARNKAKKENIKRTNVFKWFFIRRALRIFPIYFLYITLLSLFSKEVGNYEMKFLITYTPNIYFFKVQHWNFTFSHLWSLGVEEQFYILWPWLILFLNKRWMPHVLAATAFTGIVCEYSVRNNLFGQMLPYTCLDSLAMGALLAWIFVEKPVAYLKKTHIILSAGFVILLIVLFIQTLHQQWSFIVARESISIFGMWLINYIMYRSSLPEEKQSLKFLLENKTLMFIGKISYGIYMYHLVIPKIFQPYFEKLNSLLPKAVRFYSEDLLMIECIGTLLLISWLSYVLIEEKALELKKYIRLKKPLGVPQKKIEQLAV